MIRKMQCLLLFIFTSFLCLAQQSSAIWEDLFNGKNLKGWKVLNGTAEYQTDNNELVGISKTGTPNTFLVTKKTYGDFILEYEMKMEQGLNSGVQIRSLSLDDYDNGRVHGYQIECDGSDRAWSAGIYDEARRGWLYPLEYNKPAKTAYMKGEWNKYRVEAIGNSIRVWLNGIPASNLVDDLTKEGFIGLQVHGIGNNSELEGKTIRWKNIRIMTGQLEQNRTAMSEGVREVSYLNNQLTDKENSQGWQLLWDGKSTEGWRGARLDGFPSKGWKMENGVLTVQKSDGGESANGGDIVTRKKYKNFILEVDFKLTEGANSGIKYFVQTDLNKGEGSAIGCEYQLLDDEKHPDAKMGVLGNRTLASLYDLITANAKDFDENLQSKRINGNGSWNRARIEVRGKIVTHFINGTKVVEYERGTQQWRALVNYSKYQKWPGFGEFEEGHILLQDHGDEVSFRNIKILEL